MLPKPSADSPPMFENKLFDTFSRTPWYIVPVLHLPLVALATFSAIGAASMSPGRFLGFVVLGWLTWTFTEYWAHRTLFHWQPPGKFGERMHFILHGVHHQWPRDKYRLVFPPALSLSLAVLVFFVFRAVLGNDAFGFYAGFAVGYVFYDCIHYYVHWGKPKAKWLKDLRRHHLIHHSPKKGVDVKYGVSTTIWDHVFRTL